MPKEDSPMTSKYDRSQEHGWSVDKWWAEMIARSDPKNLTPLQRRELVNRRRRLRRAISEGRTVE